MQPLVPYFQTVEFKIPMPDFMPMEVLVLHGFGLCVGIGLIYGSQLARSRAARLGLDQSVMNELFIWLVIGVVVGGHIGYGLFYHPKEYLANPILFLDVRSGLSSFGGFITCVIAFTWVLKRRNQPFLPFADSIVYGFAFGWFFGRLGCTLNHEHPGTPTNFFLGRFCRPVEGYTIEWPTWMGRQADDLRFNNCVDAGAQVTSYAQKVALDYQGVLAEHDMGMYEMLYAAILFVILVILDRKTTLFGRFKRFDGLYALILVYTYTPLRFAMDFLRPLEGNARYSGLTPAQWGCIGFLIVTTVILFYFIRLNKQEQHLNQKPI